MIGRTVGDWQLAGRIGEAEAGVRYEARHVRATARRADVLVLHRTLAPPPAARARFVEGAAAASRIRHDHLVRVIEGDIEGDGTAWIAHEPAAGRSLADLIAEGPLDADRASAVALEAASGLAVAHAQGFLHRDLSPERLLLLAGDDGVERVRVADFALARLVGAGAGGATAGRVAAVLGAPACRAPEEWRGADVDGRADIYSLGAILFECLAARPPFVARTSHDWRRAHLEQAPPDLARTAGAPADLASLVARMLEKKRSARPRTMDEVVVILKTIRAKAARAVPRSTVVSADGGIGALARAQHDPAPPPAGAGARADAPPAGAAARRGAAAAPPIAPTEHVNPLAFEDAAPARSRTPLLVAAVAFAVLAGGGLLVLRGLMRKPAAPAVAAPPVVAAAPAAPATPSPPPGPQEPLEPLVLVIVRLEHAADEALRAREWDHAIARCDEALRLDPVNEGLKDRRDRAAREAKAKTMYDAFRIAVDGGQAEMAIQLYQSIPETSVYRAEAAPAYEALRRSLPARRPRPGRPGHRGHAAPAKPAAAAAAPRDPMPALRNLKDPFSHAR